MGGSRQGSSSDRELVAIGTILGSLEGLEGESIQRVLDYVFSRLSIARPTPFSLVAPLPPVSASSSGDTSRRHPSIRDLKEEKNPESTNHMAAIVAYYLSEVVQEPDQADYVTTMDLEKFFKQAGFKLPKSIGQTLQNATAAGYFDSLGGGRYKLNPVGYNLVVHGLPRGQTPASSKQTTKTARR